MNVGLLIHVNL